VIAPPHPNQATSEASGGTLGDLLYADKDKLRVAEEEWVGLVQAIATGDQLALHALYERANRPVFTLIMRITNNRLTAEELTLDVFHDVWRRASNFDAAAGSVLGWVMNQARSRAIDRVRFEQRKKRVNPHPDGESAAVDPVEIGGEREQAHLQQALSVLSPEERQAIESAFFGDLTYAEVATRLSLPLGTIKTRIRSGLAKLREALATEAER
jgi:RNA polymerase sigma-70 factor (ECF subfamily)